MLLLDTAIIKSFNKDDIFLKEFVTNASISRLKKIWMTTYFLVVIYWLFRILQLKYNSSDENGATIFTSQKIYREELGGEC